VIPSPGDLRFRDSDVVILAMKSQDTAAALQALSAVTSSDVPVVCAQNGVENERTALRRFRNVYGICVMCPTTHLAPGVVQVHSSPTTGLLDIGRWPGGSDHLAHAVATALQSATFSSEVRDDIARWKWGKLIMNLSNAVEAVCGSAARGGQLTARATREGIACLEAAGIAYVGTKEDKERRGDLLRQLPVGGVTRSGGSSWQSLARSSGSVETDYLNGEIVLLGRLHGVATPVNAALQGLANALAREKRPPGSISEEDVLAEVPTGSP